MGSLGVLPLICLTSNEKPRFFICTNRSALPLDDLRWAVFHGVFWLVFQTSGSAVSLGPHKPKNPMAEHSQTVWAQAIHAVTVQKMSLRGAAQLYGVNHASLHRRVRSQRHTVMQPSRSIDMRSNDAERPRVSSLNDQVRHLRLGLQEDSMPPPLWIHGRRLSSPPRDYDQDSGESDSSSLASNSVISPPMASFSRSTSAGSMTHGSPVKQKVWRQTNIVPRDVWEHAMNAVEKEGMSLRNAANAYGVHFAALYRRLKKRNDKKKVAAAVACYIPEEDESGIVRVVEARAGVGIHMKYDELESLLHQVALKYAQTLSKEMFSSLMHHFRSRTESTIRHIVRDWPQSSVMMLPPPPRPLTIQIPETRKPGALPSLFGPGAPQTSREFGFPQLRPIQPSSYSTPPSRQEPHGLPRLSLVEL